MATLSPHPQYPYTLAVCELALRNQRLLSRSLDLELFSQARELKQLDSHLAWLFLYFKALDSSSVYRWQTQGDDKVRDSHAENRGKVFSWHEPPATGHPGEAINCRCWAQPLDVKEYARQTLISAVNDNPEKWTQAELANHYLTGNGEPVTLQQIGYLMEVINHYKDHAVASDGLPGVYRAINLQIVERAREVQSGDFDYDFTNTYDFEDAVLFELGDSTISGQFSGNVRKEHDRYLVINGIVTYDFFDEYKDPASFVETLVDFGVPRGTAEAIVGDSGDFAGTVYPIVDHWETKFNATVLIEK